MYDKAGNTQDILILYLKKNYIWFNSFINIIYKIVIKISLEILSWNFTYHIFKKIRFNLSTKFISFDFNNKARSLATYLSWGFNFFKIFFASTKIQSTIMLQYFNIQLKIKLHIDFFVIAKVMFPITILLYLYDLSFL